MNCTTVHQWGEGTLENARKLPAVFLVLLQVGFFHALVLTNICARVWSAKNDTKYERTDSNNRWRFAVAAAAAVLVSREHTAEQNHGVLKFAKRRPCLATQRCSVQGRARLGLTRFQSD